MLHIDDSPPQSHAIEYQGIGHIHVDPGLYCTHFATCAQAIIDLAILFEEKVYWIGRQSVENLCQQMFDCKGQHCSIVLSADDLGNGYFKRDKLILTI